MDRGFCAGYDDAGDTGMLRSKTGCLTAAPAGPQHAAATSAQVNNSTDSPAVADKQLQLAVAHLHAGPAVTELSPQAHKTARLAKSAHGTTLSAFKNPLGLAQAHLELARAYWADGCGQQVRRSATARDNAHKL